MSASWSPDELHLVDAAEELHIAVVRFDGSPGRWVPIWVVCAGGQVYVRTWYRRDTGWFGQALRSGQARVPHTIRSSAIRAEYQRRPAHHSFLAPRGFAA